MNSPTNIAALNKQLRALNEARSLRSATGDTPSSRYISLAPELDPVRPPVDEAPIMQVLNESAAMKLLIDKSGSAEAPADDCLSPSEYETLCDVLLGLTDKAIARRRNLSARGVQNRVAALFCKVLRGKNAWVKESASMDVYNLRARLIFEVLRRGLIDKEKLASLDQELSNWVNQEFGV